MKKEIIKHLTRDFESCVNHTKNGIEFWFARDLQHLLGYTEWRNFIQVIHKAKTSCETAGHQISDHFVDVNKTIAMPKGASKEIPDFMLTRFACYLIAQNGDPRKEAIAFAQNYFAVQTCKFEIIEQRIKNWERLLVVADRAISQVDETRIAAISRPDSAVRLAEPECNAARILAGASAGPRRKVELLSEQMPMSATSSGCRFFSRKTRPLCLQSPGCHGVISPG